MPPTKPELEQQLETAANQTPGSQTEIKIEVGDTEITFNCVNEVDPNTKSSNVIAYTTENEFNVEVGSLIETLSTSFAKLLPEGLQTQPITFKNLMVIYSKNKTNITATNRTSKWGARHFCNKYKCSEKAE